MEVNTKKAGMAIADKIMISNSYGSTNCIRFEGIISARLGHPFVLLEAKVREKEE